MDEFLAQVLGRNRLLGNLAQRYHRVLVVVAFNRDLRAGGDQSRAVTRQQNEIEPILDLIDTISTVTRAI